MPAITPVQQRVWVALTHPPPHRLDRIRQLSERIGTDRLEMYPVAATVAAAVMLLRYVCAPVLSEENFWTLVGSPKSKVVRPAYADKAAEVIAPVVDPVPWVAAGRDPTEVESFAAILSTVVLLAAQRVGTGARGVASKRQEAEVAALLEGRRLRL